jgi:hypothetical protein
LAMARGAREEAVGVVLMGGEGRKRAWGRVGAAGGGGLDGVGQILSRNMPESQRWGRSICVRNIQARGER